MSSRMSLGGLHNDAEPWVNPPSIVGSSGVILTFATPIFKLDALCAKLEGASNNVIVHTIMNKTIFLFIFFIIKNCCPKKPGIPMPVD